MAYYLPWLSNTADNASRIVTALDGYTVPFSYNAPADPVTTGSSTVTTDGELSTAIALGSREITIASGAYGSPNFNTNNLDIICQSGVTFTGMTVAANSFRITGGGGTTVNGPLTLSGTRTDLMFDNITVNMSGVFDSIVPDNMSRVCFKNCTITSSSNWGIIGGVNGADFFFVASESEYTGAVPGRCPARLIGIVRAIVVNSRLASTQQGFRAHNATGVSMTHLCVARNQVECIFWIDPRNGAPGEGDDVVMGPGWIVDNNAYRSGETQTADWGNNSGNMMDSFTITRNRAYCGAVNDTTITFIASNTTNPVDISNNLNKTYVSTPAYSGGAS